MRLFPEAGAGIPGHPAPGMRREISWSWSWSHLWYKYVHPDGYSTRCENEVTGRFLQFSKNRGAGLAGKGVNKCHIRNVAFHSSGGWGTVRTWGHCAASCGALCHAGVLEAGLRSRLLRSSAGSARDSRQRGIVLQGLVGAGTITQFLPGPAGSSTDL